MMNMMKQLFTLACVLFFCGSSPAEGIWQHYSYEEFTVALPSPPEVTTNAMQTTLLSFDHSEISSVGYLLISSALPPVYRGNSADYFERYLEIKSIYPHVLAEFCITESQGYPTLDLVCFNQNSNMFIQERVIATPVRVYALYTTSYMLGCGDHNRFTSSFMLR